MKYFLIGFAIYFAIAWLPQFVRAWVLDIRYKFAKKRANENDEWMYMF